jgi:hypothetical protein
VVCPQIAEDAVPVQREHRIRAQSEVRELRATLLGGKQVLKEAQDLMIQRLSRLDRETVKSIFRVARFNIMDQEQVKRLRSKGSQDVDEAVLDEWTNTFMKRIEEIRTAKNCKAN